MSVSESGVFDAQIVHAVVELCVCYHQRVKVRWFCRGHFDREPGLKRFGDMSVEIDVVVIRPQCLQTPPVDVEIERGVALQSNRLSNVRRFLVYFLCSYSYSNNTTDYAGVGEKSLLWAFAARRTALSY